MQEKRELQYTYNDVNFNATIIYDDKLFRERYPMNPYYHVQLHEPIELDCGGEFAESYTIPSMTDERRYTYSENTDTSLDGKFVNVYPLVINKILYSYFNRDKIAYYEKKIQCLIHFIEDKYASSFEEIKNEKSLLKRELREKKIDNKIYQKRLKAIKIKSSELEKKLLSKTSMYRRHYFKCCELKKRYRNDFSAKPKENCNDLEICRIIKFIKHMNKEK